MQYLILALWLWQTVAACRRIRRDPRQYRRCAWTAGMLIAAAMAVQELILLFSDQLSWGSALPLHLCSLMGVLTLPMLLTRSRMLCSAALFAGIPGAVLALIFPAVLATPWPRLTALAFHTMHAGLVCAPWLAVAGGWQPQPTDAFRAGAVLLLAGLAAMLVNPLTGGNYLFLAYPIAGTPLAWLGQWGTDVYRILLALLAGGVLGVGGLMVWLFRKKNNKNL